MIGFPISSNNVQKLLLRWCIRIRRELTETKGGTRSDVWKGYNKNSGVIYFNNNLHGIRVDRNEYQFGKWSSLELHWSPKKLKTFFYLLLRLCLICKWRVRGCNGSCLFRQYYELFLEFGWISSFHYLFFRKLRRRKSQCILIFSRSKNLVPIWLQCGLQRGTVERNPAK